MGPIVWGIVEKKGSLRLIAFFLPPWNASLHWVLFSIPSYIRRAHASEVNAFCSFVFYADLSWMQSPLTAVDSWISLGRPQQCQVNCPAATSSHSHCLSHTSEHTHWAKARPSVTVSFSVAVSVLISVHISLSSSLLLWGSNSNGWLCSTWRGP